MGANPVGVQLIDSVARGTDTARSVKTNSFIVDGEEDHPTLTRSRSSKRKEVRRSEIGSPMVCDSPLMISEVAVPKKIVM